jgi:serine/threonine protein kinase
MIHDKEKVFGMAPYVAPELFGHKDSRCPPPFSKKTDIYSLGVLLWELSSGCPPLKNYGSMAIIYNAYGGKCMKEEKIPGTPTDYHKLYTDCWNDNPEERPIIENVHNKLKNIVEDKNKEVEDDNDTNVMLNGLNLLQNNPKCSVENEVEDKNREVVNKNKDDIKGNYFLFKI